nr:NAD(P)-dependent oxidoreductase [bacterium]
MKLLHIARGASVEPRLLPPVMQAELEKLGELTILTYGNRMSEQERAEHIRSCDVLLTGWWSAIIPDDIARDPGRLRYILNISGSVQPWIKACHIEAGIPVTNWGDAPAQTVAEGAMALLLACMKNLRKMGKLVEAGYWTPSLPMTSLFGLRVGIYGMGVIGRKFVDMLRPFGPIITAFDPYAADWPEGVTRVDSLDALFANADAIVLHAALTEETRHSVTARHLAMLPDDGIIINTARGGIIDQEALLSELYTGRLRAGIDVLDGSDALPENHPARQWPNLFLTCHEVSGDTWPDNTDRLQNFHQYALDNLRRFIAGQPLRFVMDITRYNRST